MIDPILPVLISTYVRHGTTGESKLVSTTFLQMLSGGKPYQTAIFPIRPLDGAGGKMVYETLHADPKKTIDYLTEGEAREGHATCLQELIAEGYKPAKLTEHGIVVLDDLQHQTSHR